MTRPRDRRPRPETPTAEEAADIEARYRLLYKFLQRLAAHRAAHQQARDPDGDALADSSDSAGA